MNDRTKTSELEPQLLAALIDAYGADPSRWPSDDADLLSRMALDQSLSEKMQEARELDLLLDQAPQPDAPAGAIERLLARVDREEQQSAASNVVAISKARASRPHPIGRQTMFGRPSYALMAASLLLGLYLGQADFVNDVVGAAIGFEDSQTALFDEPLYWLSLDAGSFTEETL
jgi:hypothetical protein